MCRWILLTHDRVEGDEFPLTQEYLSLMLGVRRPTVSTAAHILQKAGLIAYKRGRMTILDPEGLVEGSCECYELMEREMDRVFETPWRELAHREYGKKS